MTRAVAVFVLLLVAEPAHADELDEARRLNELGIEAMQERLDFVRARQLFERSLAVHPTPAAAFNLGHAHHSQGSPREAIAIWGRVLAGEYGQVDAPQREQLLRMIAEASAMVATLDVRLLAPGEARLRIDGEPRGSIRAGRTAELPVNPGRRVVTATAEDHGPVERVVEVAPGGRAPVELTLTALPSRSVFESAWFWIVTGAVVLLVAAGAAVWIAAPFYDDPQEPPPFGSAITLTSR